MSPGYVACFRIFFIFGPNFLTCPVASSSHGEQIASMAVCTMWAWMTLDPCLSMDIVVSVFAFTVLDPQSCPDSRPGVYGTILA